MKQMTEVRILEREAAKRQQQRERLDAKQAKLDEEEREHARKVEEIILDEIRKAALTKLPLTKVLQAIREIAGLSEAPAFPNGYAHRENDGRMPESRSAGSFERPKVDRKLTEASVKISANTSAENRGLLQDCKMKWNGRLGVYRGLVNDRELEILSKTFGDRVTVKPHARPDEGGLPVDPSPKPTQSPSGSVETLPEPWAPTTSAVESSADEEAATTPDTDNAREDPPGAALPLTNPLRRLPIGLPRRPQGDENNPAP